MSCAGCGQTLTVDATWCWLCHLAVAADEAVPERPVTAEPKHPDDTPDDEQVADRPAERPAGRQLLRRQLSSRAAVVVGVLTTAVLAPVLVLVLETALGPDDAPAPAGLFGDGDFVDEADLDRPAGS